MSLIQTLKSALVQLPGWRTNRKLIVIESDDWGSIRMPSLKAFENLRSAGLDLDSGDALRYNQNDTLASAEDLDALFSVLNRFRDGSGRPPVFTAISVVANPDFDAIRNDGFRKYHYEPFTKTLERYRKEDAFSYWKQGISSRLFVPEFHGREHLNVAAWMRALGQGDKQVLAAFDEGCWGFNNLHPFGLMYQAAFDLEYAEDLAVQHEVVASGLRLFEELLGYKSRYFVPPNGPFNNDLEKTAAQNGVDYMSASKRQFEVLGEGKTRVVYHSLGQKNAWGQQYITRNAFFEPSQAGKEWISSCLSDISLAFTIGKPAVISSHRVNFIGGLRKENRDKGLQQLDSLFTAILKKWPQAEFVTSTELGDIMAGKA